MYCTKCGNKLLENEKFCSKCGHEVRQEAESDNDLNKELDIDKRAKLGLLVLILGILVFLLIFFSIKSRRFNPEKMEQVIYNSINLRLSPEEEGKKGVAELITKESDSINLGLKNINLSTIKNVVPTLEKLGGTHEVEIRYVESSANKINKKEYQASYEITIKFYLNKEIAAEYNKVETLRFVYENGKWLWDAR